MPADRATQTLIGDLVELNHHVRTHTAFWICNSSWKKERRNKETKKQETKKERTEKKRQRCKIRMVLSIPTPLTFAAVGGRDVARAAANTTTTANNKPPRRAAICTARQFRSGDEEDDGDDSKGTRQQHAGRRETLEHRLDDEDARGSGC